MPTSNNPHRHYPTFTQQELDKETWIQHNEFILVSNLGRGKLTQLGQDRDKRQIKSEFCRVIYNTSGVQFKYEDIMNETGFICLQAKASVVHCFLIPNYKPKTIHYHLRVIHRDGNPKTTELPTYQ